MEVVGSKNDSEVNGGENSNARSNGDPYFDRESIPQSLLSKERKRTLIDIAPLYNSSKSVRSWISLDFASIRNEFRNIRKFEQL